MRALLQHLSNRVLPVLNFVSKQPSWEISRQRYYLLLPFIGNKHQEKTSGISFNLKDYLTLVDETGRVIREDKRCAIETKTANILSRLHISDESWLKLTTNFEGIFTGALGTAEHLCVFTDHVGLKRAHGKANAQAYLNSA